MAKALVAREISLGGFPSKAPCTPRVPLRTPFRIPFRIALRPYYGFRVYGKITGLGFKAILWVYGFIGLRV